MNINIIAVGKVRENYIKEGIEEFIKRLTPHAKVNIIEVADESAPESLSEGEREMVKIKEGERILKKIKENDYVVALDSKGKKLTSEEFAQRIKMIQLGGNSTIDFIIGGSNGLCGKVLKRANFVLSFSLMTFPHQLMRLILLEQVYRAFRIINNYPYHK
ncbi:23S rRNA (pseudouridine(1915)-N(3))-methyltransferase RlmH [Anaerosphaera multitolerans]|uniref:Ribosomal RNA large subunit methyltransferase H n=1 Tax=Anaerosphaera multitolerans TaxID=2487351 RepID=A0A437S9N5_9FIRM|nr:23S rRNA (pseudouridine(1915)-N(3))-methyltransferase RlmH [Anaerosphaera multitolerans]RVU55702.1 23S rRNA (pseudouridine(1915)-N(3))-methyltransferase RlmH [Anaerosphaera multitolerans]